jgi:hypothetical protein
MSSSRSRGVRRAGICLSQRLLQLRYAFPVALLPALIHLIVRPIQTEEEMIDCRIDHYQTPTEIHLSVYAKQVDRARSKVQFDDEHVRSLLLLHGHPPDATHNS